MKVSILNMISNDRECFDMLDSIVNSTPNFHLTYCDLKYQDQLIITTEEPYDVIIAFTDRGFAIRTITTEHRTYSHYFKNIEDVDLEYLTSGKKISSITLYEENNFSLTFSTIKPEYLQTEDVKENFQNYTGEIKS